MTTRQEAYRTGNIAPASRPTRMTVLIGDAREARRGYKVTSPPG
ncbi:hypothetical protein AB0C74_24170 [Spirillospora sp. NPDC048832]